MIIVLAHVTVHDGFLGKALALSREHVARSRAEPGCISHGVLQDAENPLRLVFVEQWADRAALRLHFTLPASITFAKALGALASVAPSMAIYDAAPVER